MSRRDTLASLYHSDTNGFRQNLRSAIREYMFSSNGSFYPDDNLKELASKIGFMEICVDLSQSQHMQQPDDK